MKFYSTIFTALAVLLTTFALSEATVAQDRDLDYETVRVADGNTIYTENVTDVQGNPLIKDSFENGRILYRDGKASEIYPLNYNAYQNQVLFIKDRQVMVLNLNNVKGFIFNTPPDFDQSDKVQEVFSFQVKHENLDFEEPTPVQVMYNMGTGLQLIAVHKSSLMRGNSKDPYTGKTIDRYMSGVEYYLIDKDGELNELRRLRSRDIIRSFDREHQDALNDFMDDNNLDGDSQKDLVKLLTYYDNMTNQASN
jgi:hypothetical protein